VALITRLVVIFCGYLVVIAFFAIFLALGVLPHDLYGFEIPPLDTTERLVVSVVVVAPVILGLLWDRVKGLKFWEIELVLKQASPPINVELSSMIQRSEGSATLPLLKLIAAAIAQQDLRLVEVNLRSRPYWWTTRLFLLAALLQEYTDVKQIVVAKHGALRTFVGIATPASVRRILGERFPPLEETFRSLLTDAPAVETKQEKVYTIGYQFPAHMFLHDGALLSEGQFRQKVDASTLCEWLGAELQTETRQWCGGPPSNRIVFTPRSLPARRPSSRC
jgi:hypothetical protein